MIVDLIFSAVKAIIQPVLNIFPTWSLTSTLGIPSGIGGFIGSWLHPLNGVLALQELFTMIAAAAALILAFYAVYKLGNWAWRHIPDLGGFGPGAG